LRPRQVLRVDEIDLSATGFWSRPWDEREGAFEVLRRERPVAYFSEASLERMNFIPEGAGYFAVTRHADILEASRTPEVFCSARGATSIFDLPAPFLEFFGSFINMDDPEHLRLRKLVSGGFTPRHLSRLEEYVQRTATEVIDGVIEKGSCDFVTELSGPFPIRIICDMMGIPASQHGFVFDRTNIILGAGDPEYVPEGTDIAAALLGAGKDLAELMKDLRKHRLANPTGDLTSIIVNAEIDGDRLSEAELGSFFILLATAGNETTRNAISHGMHALCTFPEQRALWQQDFDGVAKSAIEEIVRWASPVIFMRRTTTRPTVLGGQELPEGAKCLLFYNSGNRDEAVFEDPYRFDVRRSPNEHVGFGGPGPHFCMGANLARREILVFFRELFRRMPDLEVTGPPDRLVSNFIHGIKHMPCAFRPGPREAAA
jgi:methyl-branched lipid omega-hydroxylase